MESRHCITVTIKTKNNGVIIHLIEISIHLSSRKLRKIDEKNKTINVNARIIPYTRRPGTGISTARIEAIYIMKIFSFIFHLPVMIKSPALCSANAQLKNTQKEMQFFLQYRFQCTKNLQTPHARPPCK